MVMRHVGGPPIASMFWIPRRSLAPSASVMITGTNATSVEAGRNLTLACPARASGECVRSALVCAEGRRIAAPPH